MDVSLSKLDTIRQVDAGMTIFELRAMPQITQFESGYRRTIYYALAKGS